MLSAMKCCAGKSLTKREARLIIFQFLAPSD